MTRYGWSFVFALAGSIACKPAPSLSVSVASAPPLVVEQQGDPPTCDLVRSQPLELEIHEHDDWLDLWIDHELTSEGEQPPGDSWSARRWACETTGHFTSEQLRCTDTGRQVLAIMHDDALTLLVVEEHEQGLRSVELSRWAQMCRCSCGSRLELLSRDPLRIVVAEYENVASEVHAEADAIVEGCREGDECTSACLGLAYGNQRVLEFGDSLDLRAAFIDDSPPEAGYWDVRFAVEQGRLVATHECTQVLSD